MVGHVQHFKYISKQPMHCWCIKVFVFSTSLARSQGVSATSSERAEREEHERQLELAEELNEHIKQLRDQLERDDSFDWDEDAFGLGLPMQHAMQSKRSGRSAFSESWYMSTHMSTAFSEVSQQNEIEDEKQREKEAVYQEQRQKIVQEKVA